MFPKLVFTTMLLLNFGATFAQDQPVPSLQWENDVAMVMSFFQIRNYSHDLRICIDGKCISMSEKQSLVGFYCDAGSPLLSCTRFFSSDIRMLRNFKMSDLAQGRKAEIFICSEPAGNSGYDEAFKASSCILLRD